MIYELQSELSKRTPTRLVAKLIVGFSAAMERYDLRIHCTNVKEVALTFHTTFRVVSDSSASLDS